MIVVVPEAHAFDVDSSYDKNQAAIDEELFHDIIPAPWLPSTDRANE
jgi:hypothetical protein